VYPGHIPPTLPLTLTLTLTLPLTPTLTLTLTLTKAELRAEAARREAAAVAAARDELLVLVTAEEKEEVREARRGKAVAEAGLRVAEKRAEAAEKRAKAAEANAERVAAEATRAKEELASFEADVACTIDAGAEQHGQDTATQEVRHKKSLCALKAVHRSALSKLGQHSSQRRRLRQPRRGRSGSPQRQSLAGHRPRQTRRARASSCRRPSWSGSVRWSRGSPWRMGISRPATLGSRSCWLESSCRRMAAEPRRARMRAPRATAPPGLSSCRTSPARSGRCGRLPSHAAL